MQVLITIGMVSVLVLPYAVEHTVYYVYTTKCEIFGRCMT